MSKSARARADEAFKRLAQFKARPDVDSVAKRYADFVETSDGIVVMMTLSLLANARLAGAIDRHQHGQSVMELAADTKLPISDVRIMADSALELLRCCLAGRGL